MIKYLSAYAVAGVALCAVLTGCGPENEPITGAGEKTVKSSDVPAAPVEEAEPDIFGMTDATKEVKVKSCAIGDLYDLGERDLYVDVEVTAAKANTEKMTYNYEVEVLSVQGNRIVTLYGMASDVRPGQTIDTGKGDGEEDSFEDGTGAPDKFTCVLTLAEKDPASNYH